MAEQDTGLGWSAESNYLIASPGLLGNISEVQGALRVPNCENTAADVVNNGVYIWRDNIYRYYYGVAADHAEAYVYRETTYNQTHVISSVGGRSVIYRGTLRVDGTGSPGIARYNFSGPSSGWYTWAEGIGNAQDINPAVPVYASTADALEHITTVDQPFYKLLGGYCVAMFARWINLNGDAVTAPVMISTDPDSVTLSTDGTTAASDETRVGLRWQNMSFTMTLITGYSGTVVGNLVPLVDLTAAYPRPINATTLFEALCYVARIRVLTTPDPYGDDAQPGGGEGNEDDEEDVDFSNTPSVGTSLGFFRMWNPSETELRDLASWMWSSAFDLDTFKRIFSAPIDAILGLSLVPVQPSVIGGYTIALGGIDTGVSAFTVTNRYVTLDCGSLTVAERWGAYLDYSPYTKMSIFLPYIGFRDISTDDVMDKTVALQYNVDVLSGACVAELKCGGTVLYSWQGNCAQQLPITSQDWSSALSAALGLAGSAAAAIISGGSSLPLAGTVASATVNALSLKPRMERGGSISGAAGAMAGQVPYLVRERPEQAVPGRQNHFIGYPSFTTVLLGDIAGYTEVESIHLEGIPATAAELDELENILKEGFIL